MSDLLSALIDLLWWPHEAWKHTTQSSRIGVSPDEKKTLRFWRAVAMTATVATLATAVVAALALLWIGE